ncbi:MAG: hypothetical protein AAFY25_08940 [Pseudomonadota bacterium]
MTALEFLQKTLKNMLDGLDDVQDHSIHDLVEPITLGFADRQHALTLGQAVGNTFDGLDTGDWQVGALDLGSGIKATNLVRMIDGTAHTVLTEVSVAELGLKDGVINGGSPVTLPLTEPYRLGYAYVQNATAPESTRHPYHRLQTSVEKSIVLLMGFLLHADGSLEAIAPPNVADAQFVDKAITAGLDNQTSSTIAVLVHVEFALCGPRDDFEPFAAAQAVRIYPRVNVWTSKPVDEINCDIQFKRPKTTQMHHAHGSPGNKKIYASMYSDRNVDDDEELTKTTIGFPYWNRIFDNYRIDVAGSPAISCVTTASSERIKTDLRKVPALVSGFILPVYQEVQTGPDQATKLRKMAKQGRLDNIHIAPAMDLNGEAVHMAPLCEHDCFHMHWRWSNGFKNTSSKGWSPNWPDYGGPCEVSGAPLIPPNQVLDIIPNGATEHPGMLYRAKAAGVTFRIDLVQHRRWHSFCHHGASYVVGLNTLPSLGIWAIDALDIGSAEFYHRLRFAQKPDGTFVPAVVESAFPAIEQL